MPFGMGIGSDHRCLRLDMDKNIDGTRIGKFQEVFSTMTQMR
jgi:hypothetical protein